MSSKNIDKQLEKFKDTKNIYINVGSCCSNKVSSIINKKYNWSIAYIKDINYINRIGERIAIINDENLSGIYLNNESALNLKCYCSSAMIKNIYNVNDINISYRMLFFNNVNITDIPKHIRTNIYMNTNIYIKVECFKNFNKDVVYQVVSNDIINVSIYIIDGDSNNDILKHIYHSINMQSHNNMTIVYYNPTTLDKLIEYRNHMKHYCPDDKVKEIILNQLKVND